jgi:parallel beta-helix repeat protein
VRNLSNHWKHILFIAVISIAALVVGVMGLGASEAEGATIIVPIDYTSIQDAIDNANAGDTIRVYAGTYNEAIVVDERVHLIGNSTTNTTININVAEPVKITVDYVNMSAFQVSGGSTAGIGLYNDGCTIEDVYCTGNARGIKLEGANRNYVANSTFTGNSYAGIGVYDSSTYNLFFGNTASNNGNFGLDVFSSSGNNEFANSTYNGNVNVGILINGNANNNRITNSTLDGNGNSALSLTTCSYITVVNCKASNSTNNHGLQLGPNVHHNRFVSVHMDTNNQDGAFASGESDTSFEQCTFTNNKRNGIYLSSVNRVRMDGGRVYKSSQNGVNIENSNDVTVTGVVIDENHWGMLVMGCNGLEVDHCDVVDSDGYGIGIQNSGAANRNRYHNNSIERNGLVLKGFDGGFSIGGATATQDNYIENNLIKDNWDGVLLILGTASGNFFIGNTFEGNTRAAVNNQFFPGPNAFYHNNFIGNTADVTTPNAADVFDNGYPSGGNYWDSYVGLDQWQGPLQNIWGSDGIGDIPHVVAGGVQDNFPLGGTFSNPLDRIMIVTPSDGELVSGTMLAEAVVVSRSVDEVRFYLDNTLVGTDPLPPYQLILDTTTLTEDFTYTLTAEALRTFGVAISDSVDFTVNNQVATGPFVTVSTTDSTYSPDDRITAWVNVVNPPGFDELVLQPLFIDSNGAMTQLPDQVYPVSSRYAFTFWLPSDIATGSLTVEVRAMGFLGGSHVWEGINRTTLTVSGLSYHDEMQEILNRLYNVSAELVLLNDTTQAAIAQALATMLAAMDGLGTNMTALLKTIWDDYNTTEAADLNTTLTALAAMWDGINSTSAAGVDSILDDLNTTRTTIALQLDTLQAHLDGEIDLSQQEIDQRVGALWAGMNTTIAALDAAIGSRLDDLEGAMADNSTALSDYIALRTAQLELYMGIVNASLHLHLDAIEDTIDSFRGEALGDLLGIATSLGVMEVNATDNRDAILAAIDGTNALISDMNSTTLEDMRQGLEELQDELRGVNSTEADRHAATVATLLARLGEVEDEVSDRLNQTDAALLTLDQLDTILSELSQVGDDVDTTQDEVTEGNTRSMMVMLFLLILILITIGFIATLIIKLRGWVQPPEPPSTPRELEPVDLEERQVIEEPMTFEEPIREPPTDGFEFEPFKREEAAPPEPVPEPPRPSREMQDWVLEGVMEEIGPTGAVETEEAAEMAEPGEAYEPEVPQEIPPPEEPVEAVEVHEEYEPAEPPDLGEPPALDEPVEVMEGYEPAEPPEAAETMEEMDMPDLPEPPILTEEVPSPEASDFELLDEEEIKVPKKLEEDKTQD